MDFSIYLAERLDLNRFKNNEIEIETKHRLPSDVYGLCYGSEDFAIIEIANKIFDESVSREIKMKTLAHEFVHAQQYFNGYLYEDSITGLSVWNRENNLKKYTWKQSHWSSPWEKQARYWEDKLYNEYMSVRR